jgi:hypothetical protein
MFDGKQTTKTLLVGMVFFLLGGFSANALASDSATLDVTGEVSAQLSIGSLNALSGWDFLRPSSGTCTYSIDPSSKATNVASQSSSSDCGVLSGANGGSFTITGDNENVSVQYTESDFSDPGVNLKSFTDTQGGSLSSNSTFTLSSPQTINVGSKIEVTDGAQTGSHTATVDITVNYQ